MPHCITCGREISSQSIDQIVDNILELENKTKIQIIAPVIALIEIMVIDDKKTTEVNVNECSWLLCKLNEPSSKPSSKKAKDIGTTKIISQPWNRQAMNEPTASIEADNNKPKYGMLDHSTKSRSTTIKAITADFISLVIFLK